jgi:hypothetical protein
MSDKLTGKIVFNKVAKGSKSERIQVYFKHKNGEKDELRVLNENPYELHKKMKDLENKEVELNDPVSGGTLKSHGKSKVMVKSLSDIKPI